ncbi:MAG: AAA family ATPase [Ilumatobacteraceae bacterium]|nr:AAA family ATPase [Ilumatobacter sp.]MCB0983032.1 AAA family ATPase [Ilumatobacter sp.]
MSRELPDVTPEQYAATAAAIEAEVGKVIVGQQALVRTVVTCLLAEGHALLEGVPGLGKTMLLKALSDAVELPFSRVQFTPDLMPADIVGTQVLEEDEHGHRAFRFRPGPVFASFLLADEVNRATPKTQSALLEAMQERAVTAGGATRPLPRPFLVMATQNPLEMEGTYPLPEAQLDRFLLKAWVPFPPADDLVTVLERTTGTHTADVHSVADAPTVMAMIGLTRKVPVASHVLRHAVDLVVATHPDGEGAPDLVRRYVRFGASPRGAQALVLAAKVGALLDGRPNVAVSDVRGVAVAALRHRMVTGYEATADGVDAEQLVAALLDAVPEPTAGMRGAS